MKIEENTVTFRFYFRGMTSKAESLKTIQSFLHEKEWLPNDSDYDLELLEYHTDNNGLCEVILKKIKDSPMEELADIFFADILKNSDIFHVSVLYRDIQLKALFSKPETAWKIEPLTEYPYINFIA